MLYTEKALEAVLPSAHKRFRYVASADINWKLDMDIFPVFKTNPQ